jgi:hypothetical protein
LLLNISQTSTCSICRYAKIFWSILYVSELNIFVGSNNRYFYKDCLKKMDHWMSFIWHKLSFIKLMLRHHWAWKSWRIFLQSEDFIHLQPFSSEKRCGIRGCIQQNSSKLLVQSLYTYVIKNYEDGSFLGILQYCTAWAFFSNQIKYKVKATCLCSKRCPKTVQIVYPVYMRKLCGIYFCSNQFDA